MRTFERIKILAGKKGRSLNQVEDDLGYGRNVLYRLKSSSPSAERLQELADYFDVSVDYLLGRTEIPKVINGQPADQSLSAKKIMMRMDTAGLTQADLNEIEQEMERFLKWRMEEIRKERNEK